MRNFAVCSASVAIDENSVLRNEAADAETTPSILRFAPIQCVEGKQDLADLAPKDCFIPAEPVECKVGQIGEAQKATREVGGRIDRFWAGAGHGFRPSSDAVRCSIRVGVDRVGPNLKSSSSAEAQNELAHQGLNAMGRPPALRRRMHRHRYGLSERCERRLKQFEPRGMIEPE
jgi:hypothetical protein